MISRPELLKKYNISVPRYTSYPTVPYWTDTPSSEEWLNSLGNSLSDPMSSLSLYVHIPFCETLCTFCGCNTSITKNHKVEDPYVDAVLQEVQLYLTKIPSLKQKTIRDLHLGGGSPTYLSESNLERLVEGLHSCFFIHPEAEFSLEVDPRRTRLSQLELLYKYGFRRLSVGVQDLDPEVQRLVNRIQSFEVTQLITDGARKIGYNSINFDLIYGLPKQTKDSIKDTFTKTLSLRPDRIAFYSYAHVPWIKPFQRLFSEQDLPSGETKRELYELGRTLLEKAGYIEIGMDHFALESDSLAIALQEKKLHRNFMGYSHNKTDTMLGLGVSAISETKDMFFQNEKLEVSYRKKITQKEIPIFRGHKLTQDDILFRELILQLMTTWKVNVPDFLMADTKNYLAEMERDELVFWQGNVLEVTTHGRPFLRIIATAFDQKMKESKPKGPLFSKAI